MTLRPILSALLTAAAVAAGGFIPVRA